MWAMVDKRGYIFPHSIRHQRKEVLASLDIEDVNTFLRDYERSITKITVQELDI